MFFTVKYLEIRHHKIEITQELLVRKHQRRFYRGIDLFSSAFPYKFFYHLRVHKRLTAGEGDAAVPEIIRSVLNYLRKYLLRRHFPSADHPGSRKTAVLTHPTADAFLGIEQLLRLLLHTFGIMAPRTAKRTALKEHCGADAGPVVYGSPFDIRNNRFIGSHA